MVLGIRGRGPGAERGREGFCGGESEDGKKALAWVASIVVHRSLTQWSFFSVGSTFLRRGTLLIFVQTDESAGNRDFVNSSLRVPPLKLPRSRTNCMMEMLGSSGIIAVTENL